MSAPQKLPAPRLQLRWERNDGSVRHCSGVHYEWLCHYELVLPLDQYDIRREVWKDGEEVGRCDELVIPMKGPSMRGGSNTPCETRDGSRYYDDPFRDGAHAQWDAKVLGNPPIYVIAPDGTAFSKQEDDERRAMGSAA